MFLRSPGTCFAYRFPVFSGADGELTGQISINAVLFAMGEASVEPMLVTSAPDDASSLVDGPQPLPGL
jgi:hypothetical protein